MSLSTPTVPLRSVSRPAAPAWPPQRSSVRPTFEPSAGGTELRGRAPRMPNTTHGWLAVLFALPLFGAGAATLRIADALARQAALGLPRSAVPPIAMAGLGFCFAIGGLTYVVYGVRGVLARRGLPALRARYPDQPWMVDFPWDLRGGRDEAPAEVGRLLWLVAVMAVVLLPFCWVVFVARQQPFAVRMMLALFGLVAVAMLGRIAYLVARRLRYGVSRIGLGSFPIAAGTTAELLLDGLSPAVCALPMRATLRCIEERFEVRGSGRNRRRVSICYELYRDEAPVAPGDARLRFELPEGAPGTRLSGIPPRYWELELLAETPGVDFRGRFLVPVY